MPTGIQTKFTVYRLYACDGSLLYVGCTIDLGKRITTHRGRKPWFDEVASITVRHYPDKESALQAETEAIDVEKPRYNLTRYGDRSETGRRAWATRRRAEAEREAAAVSHRRGERCERENCWQCDQREQAGSL